MQYANEYRSTLLPHCAAGTTATPATTAAPTAALTPAHRSVSYDPKQMAVHFVHIASSGHGLRTAGMGSARGANPLDPDGVEEAAGYAQGGWRKMAGLGAAAGLLLFMAYRSGSGSSRVGAEQGHGGGSYRKTRRDDDDDDDEDEPAGDSRDSSVRRRSSA